MKTSNIYHGELGFITRKTNNKRKSPELLGLGLNDYL